MNFRDQKGMMFRLSHGQVCQTGQFFLGKLGPGLKKALKFH
jgi:hypothetical protein